MLDINLNIPLIFTYRMMATDFRYSAEILHKNLQVTQGNIRAIPYYYLVSHACELLLKCALLKRGYTESDLKKFNLRHNLLNLLNELESKNVELSENTKAVVRMLSSQHETHDLRYTALLDNGVSTFTPPPDKIYEMLDELLMATRLSRS